MLITSLLDKYFKVAVINMGADMQKRIEDIREDFNRAELKKEILRDEEYSKLNEIYNGGNE